MSICITYVSASIYVWSVNILSKVMTFFYHRVNGYTRNNLHTYGMVTGLLNSGISLGAAAGPFLTGVLTDALDYPWTQTILAFMSLFMVGNTSSLLKLKLSSWLDAPLDGWYWICKPYSWWIHVAGKSRYRIWSCFEKPMRKTNWRLSKDFSCNSEDDFAVVWVQL